MGEARSGGAPLSATVPAMLPAVIPAVFPVPALRVPVEFTGPGAGIAELTWGQREIWEAMVRQGWLCLGGTLPLAPGTTVEDVADELSYMMSRFQSMRTRLRFDGEGNARQELFASGRTILEVYDSGDDGDGGGGNGVGGGAGLGGGVGGGEFSGPEETAAAVEAHYRTMVRDFEGEWPVRMAVVRHRGTPTHMVILSCHLIADGFGIQLITQDVESRTTAAPTGMQQLDLAHWQSSPAGQRINETSLRHWEKVLRSLPPRSLPGSDDPRQPRHWTGELRSPALKLAVQLIAERTGADSSSVFLALYAIALGRTGIYNPAVIRPVANNRFRPGLATIVSNLAQAGVCALDMAGLTVDEAVGRARRGAMIAHKHAYFDPRGLTALIDRIARDAGPGHERWTCYDWTFFNDRRFEPGSAAEGGTVATPDLLGAARARTSFRWTEKKENPFEPLFLHVEDRDESVQVVVCADTHRISPARCEALVRAMEAAAVEAAFDPEAPTRVPSSADSVPADRVLANRLLANRVPADAAPSKLPEQKTGSDHIAAAFRV